MDAAQRAEERATQTLITKLEGGLNDRLEALLQNRPDPNCAHGYMAAIWNTNGTRPLRCTSQPDQLQPVTRGNQRRRSSPGTTTSRASCPTSSSLTGDPNYPINFAGSPYPGTANLPRMRSGELDAAAGQSSSVRSATPSVTASSPTASRLLDPNLGSGTGIYGASYPIAAGIYKNLRAILADRATTASTTIATA